MIDWWIILIAAAVGAVLSTSLLLFPTWLQRPPRPIFTKGGSVIGEYLESYCKRTGIAIDKLVLVANELDDDVTVYQVQHIDFYPELWGEEHE